MSPNHSDIIPAELKHSARVNLKKVRMPKNKFIYFLTNLEGELLFDGQSFFRDEVVELLEIRSEQFRRETLEGQNVSYFSR